MNIPAAAVTPPPPRREEDAGELDLRAQMRTVIVAWLFGAAWLYTTSGAALTRFSKLLGVTPFGFGCLAAIPFLAALAQLPTSYVLERFGHRKRIFIWSNLVHRALWLVIALVPWVLPPASRGVALMSLMTLSSVLAHVATPAWVSWMADLVPGRLRGRYFSRRVQLGQFVGLVVTVLVGYAMDRADQAGNLLLPCLSILLGIAAIAGIVDILMFCRLPDLVNRPARANLSVWELVRHPLANQNFRRFLGYSFLMTFGTGFMGQFLWLYLFDVLKMSNTRANILLMCVPLLVTTVSYPFWGRLVDKFGCKPVMLVAGILVVNGGSAWILVQGDNWGYGYAMVLVATFAWPALDLAGFNLLLRMMSSRSNYMAGSATAAINSVVVAVAGTLSGLFGGAVAGTLGSWKGALFGFPLTFHCILFLVSAVLRLTAILWLFRLEEPRAFATRDVLHYMMAGIHSNLQAVTLAPVRILGQAGRWCYKLTRH